MSTAALARPRSLTEADVEMVRISDIEVGIRRRKSLGGLSSLMKSIEAHGLIHPILLRNGNQVARFRNECLRRFGRAPIIPELIPVPESEAA